MVNRIPGTSFRPPDPSISAMFEESMAQTRGPTDERIVDDIVTIDDLTQAQIDELKAAVEKDASLKQHHFALEDPNQRSGGGDYETTTNSTQRGLLRIYDQWAVGTRNLIVSAQERGIQPQGFSRIVQGRLATLETGIATSLTQSIQRAAIVALGTGTRSPRTIAALTTLTSQANNAVRTGLITRVRDSLNTKFANSANFDRSSLKTMFDANRGPVASLSGFAWTTVFSVLVTAARDQEDATGQNIRVRWLLNDIADHCAASPGRHACPELAGIYDSWAELPTVPAGNVTCIGNCRCRLESESAPGSNVWVRGLPNFVP